LPTNDHCSSNSTARVLGGKSQQLVVELLGVVTGPQGRADDRVLVRARQSAGLTDAAALLEVGEDVEDLVVGEAGAKQGSALALLAGAAGEQAALLVLTLAEGAAAVVAAAAAVVGALGVLAAETAEVIGPGSSPVKVFIGT
jgi:hypothetical protein